MLPGFFSCSVSAGCMVGPRYHPPAPQTPEAWKNSESQEACPPYADFWWEVFEDPQLSALEVRAIENNKNLYIALERVQEARALTGIARADLYPQLSLVPAFSNQIILGQLYTNTAAPFFREHQRLYNLPLSLSYEVDLWGRLRSLYQSAYFHWEAEADAYYAALLILTSDLATSYYQLPHLGFAKGIAYRDHKNTAKGIRYQPIPL